MYIASATISEYNTFGEFTGSKLYPIFTAETRQECCDFCTEFEFNLKQGDIFKIGEREFTIVSVNDMDELGRFMINDRDYLNFEVLGLSIPKLERIVEK